MKNKTIEKNMLSLWGKANQLKDTKRYAAYIEDQDFIDSPAEHSWRMTLMAIDIFKRYKIDIDLTRVVEVITFHDLPEHPLEKDFDLVELQNNKSLNGVKADQEEATMQSVASDCDAAYAYDLYREYEDQKTSEGKFVKLIDKMEAMHNIIERSKANSTKIKDADICLMLCDKYINNFPVLIPVLVEIKKEYRSYLKGSNQPWEESWLESHNKAGKSFKKNSQN